MGGEGGDDLAEAAREDDDPALVLAEEAQVAAHGGRALIEDAGGQFGDMVAGQGQQGQPAVQGLAERGTRESATLNAILVVDGFASTTAGVRGRFAVSADVAIDGALRWTDSDADLDGFPAPAYALADTSDTQSSRQWSGFGRLRLKASGLEHQFSLSASDIARETVSRLAPIT